MKTSKVLRVAKQYLNHEVNQGICLALSDARRARAISNASENRVGDIISDRIQPFAYATTWLAYAVTTGKNPPKNYNNVTNDEYTKYSRWKRARREADLQAWRHRWVDNMIAEFEAKGD